VQNDLGLNVILFLIQLAFKWIYSGGCKDDETLHGITKVIFMTVKTFYHLLQDVTVHSVRKHENSGKVADWNMTSIN
jgi:hypothetical protein